MRSGRKGREPRRPTATQRPHTTNTTHKLPHSFASDYDLDASDHSHYGIDDDRPLAKVVDIMMLHVALNGYCGPSKKAAKD